MQRKAEKDIPVSPLDADIERFVTYFEDGSVEGCGEEGCALVQTLGLNAKYLQTLRKNAIESYIENQIDDIDTEIEKLHSLVDGKYQPFCFVISQLLSSSIEDKELFVTHAG